MKKPEGYTNVSLYLVVTEAAKQIDFLKQVFGAPEKCRHTSPDGEIQHAEVQIGDSTVMIGQAGGPWKPRQTTSYVYVDDVDSVYRRALQAGAKSINEPEDKPYGDRNAGFEDAWGNYWWIGTPIS
jgi:PhnB protein